MLSAELIAAKLNGSKRERRELARAVLEIVHRVAHYTLRASRGPRDLRDDFVHDILLLLFRNDAKLLRAWNPERASLDGYLGMITGRYVRRRLRGRSFHDPTVHLDPADVSIEVPDIQLAYRAALEQLYDWLHEHGSDKDRTRFVALFVDQYSPVDIARDEDVSVDAIYAWRSRLKGRLAQALPHALELIRHGADGGGASDDPDEDERS